MVLGVVEHCRCATTTRRFITKNKNFLFIYYFVITFTKSSNNDLSLFGATRKTIKRKLQLGWMCTKQELVLIKSCEHRVYEWAQQSRFFNLHKIWQNWCDQAWRSRSVIRFLDPTNDQPQPLIWGEATLRYDEALSRFKLTQLAPMATRSPRTHKIVFWEGLKYWMDCDMASVNDYVPDKTQKKKKKLLLFS